MNDDLSWRTGDDGTFAAIWASAQIVVKLSPDGRLHYVKFTPSPMAGLEAWATVEAADIPPFIPIAAYEALEQAQLQLASVETL